MSRDRAVRVRTGALTAGLVAAAAVLPALLPAAARAEDRPKLRIGDPVPALTLPRVGGGTLALRELRGHPVAYSFFAISCAPCRREVPALARAVARVNRDLPAAAQVRVVVISLDDLKGHDLVRAHPEATWLWDKEDAARAAFDPRTFPCTFLADARGLVRHINRGFGPGYEARVERWLRGLARDRTRE
jgi:peroxiredoxin